MRLCIEDGSMITEQHEPSRARGDDRHGELQDHDRGLAFDLSTLVRRRRMLQMLGGAGLFALVGCGSSTLKSSGSSATSATSATSGTSGSAATAVTSATTAASSGSVEAVPEETAGPYPGDGSNGVNVLTESGIVRSDIRSSFGSASGVAGGVPTTIKLTVVEAGAGDPVSGAAVYLWHCDRDGNYSLYSPSVTNENYLRGVQETDSSGTATFTSIYPACYSGRWPHIHFEVYPSLDEATSAGSTLATSQIALTEDVSRTVYATDGYSQSVSNLSQVSLATDMVFSDGAELETPAVTGSVADGYVVALKVGVSS
jgi:protocatechuate 3,4-dioxygenase beta subunit